MVNQIDISIQKKKMLIITEVLSQTIVPQFDEVVLRQ